MQNKIEFKIVPSSHLTRFSCPIPGLQHCKDDIVFGYMQPYTHCIICKEPIPEHIVTQMKLLDGVYIWK